MKIQRWFSLFAVLVTVSLLPAFAASPSDPIPFDPNVRVGKLPNGLTYYIRHNVKPERRVELRLAVNTGSVQEDDDQLGLAHLIEHLCFSGTKSFPKTDLIHYLQSVGSNFGPDVNAYTAFDETVYMLTLPTDKEDILANGLKIMREWAHDVTFDPKEIDRERGVVVEEWRLGRGAGQRMRDKYLPVVFKDSKYASRLPIGTKESIETMSYATVQRFYHDWYRPDLMCFVVVGDIDVDQIEQEIRAQFSTIPKAENARPHETYAVPDNDAPLYSIVSDPENPNNQIILAFKTATPHYETLADLQRWLTERLYLQLLNLRFAELREQANPPFVFAGAGYGHLWVRSKGAYQLFCVVPDGGIDRGLATLLTENERVRLHGFTPAELDRAKKSMLSQLEQQYLNRDKTESNRLVGGYVAHFLADDPVPGIEFEYQFAEDHLGGVSLEDVNALPKQWVTSRNRLVVVQSVQKANVALPTSAELQQVAATVASAAIEPYHEKQLASALMTKKPQPGRIVAEKQIPDIGVTELTLANGVRVVLKPTTFKNDEVSFSIERAGGQSVFPDDYNLSAELATAYARESGVGEFSAVELRKMLAGKVVWVAPTIQTYAETISGNSSVRDLETEFQLIHLYFTAPRADQTAYQSMMTRTHAMLQNQKLNPMASFFDEMQRIRYNRHPRTPGVLPTDADWATVSFDKVYQVYRDRFRNAAGFTFVIVGSFTVDAIKPLIETYVASLPSTGQPETYKDLGVRSIAGPFSQDIHRGTDPKALVVLGIEGPASYSLAEAQMLYSLRNIIERALIDKLRLELGDVYTVNTNSDVTPIPYEKYSLQIMVPCAPENVTKLIAAAEGEIARIKKNGVRPDEIEKEVESQRRMYEKDLKDNNAWTWKLAMIYRLHEPFTRVSNPEALIAYITPDNMQRTANKYLDVSKFVQFTMYPAGPTKPAVSNPSLPAPASPPASAPAASANAR